jgi:hypothetical protein
MKRASPDLHGDHLRPERRGLCRCGDDDVRIWNQKSGGPPCDEFLAPMLRTLPLRLRVGYKAAFFFSFFHPPAAAAAAAARTMTSTQHPECKSPSPPPPHRLTSHRRPPHILARLPGPRRIRPASARSRRGGVHGHAGGQRRGCSHGPRRFRAGRQQPAAAGAARVTARRPPTGADGEHLAVFGPTVRTGSRRRAGSPACEPADAHRAGFGG